MPQYAYFPGFPGDCIRDGKPWITLDGWSDPTWKGAPRTRLRSSWGYYDLVMFVRGTTAASAFAQAKSTGKRFPIVEIAITNAQELQFLLIRMKKVVITSVGLAPAAD